LNLGVLYGLGGNVETSNTLALRAADRSVRDLSAQTAAINLSLGKKDYSDALKRIDGLLRSRPEYSENYFPVLLNIASSHDGLIATSQMLAGAPVWRKKFFEYAVKIPERLSIVYSIFSGLRSLKSEVSSAELRAYLTELFNRKDYETAYFVWLDFLSPTELLKTGNIYDGGFDYPIRNLFYGWNIIPIANADVSVGALNGTANDLALKMNFQRSRVTGVNVFQYLRLDPGKYLLKADVSAERLETTGGLMWQVRCMESGNFIGKGTPILSSSPRVNYEFSFTVEDQQCQTQELFLIAASSASIDQVISGQVTFDNFSIVKEG
jgi:hypothetical protein